MYHYTVTKNPLFLRFIGKVLYIYFYFFLQLSRGIQKAFLYPFADGSKLFHTQKAIEL